ncbi:uncharacterized protein LOC118424284 [Branchiostoma floridae]|uniref:Uncharacterized protein LOC118424284 n=1 Tax=Branchiostoma floridae TaxID=7739 RepID=A0A9J7LT98_BRAFL|nr:uncharacterized protein LOC118424284 [Branchiostoma floridae]
MNSKLNRNIASYNDAIERSCLADNDLIYIRHRLLSEDRSLYKPDGIHIKPDTGVRLLVADVKRTLRHQREAHAVNRTDRQDRNPTSQHRNPGRNGASVSYRTQSDRHQPLGPRQEPPRKPVQPDRRPSPGPLRMPQRNPPLLFPWNQVPPSPPQWNHKTGPSFAETGDKRQTVETLMNMLADFLRH